MSASGDEIVISAPVWKYAGPAGWYFVSLDPETSDRVDRIEGIERVGLGYVKVRAKLGETEWGTTLFPDKRGFYLLAIKAAVRKAERVHEGETVEIRLAFDRVSR